MERKKDIRNTEKENKSIIYEAKRTIKRMKERYSW